MISSDWQCVRCGYNLRGLSRTGRCPECNTPVARSLRMRYLGGKSPEWLRAVRDGALILSVCYAVEVFRNLFVEAALWIHVPTRVLLGITSTGVHLTLYGVECIGIWLLVKPEPLSIDRGSVSNAVWIRRLYLLGFLASGLYRFFLLRYFLRDVSRAWVIGELLLLIVVEALLYSYLARLSQRIPDLSLAARFSVLVWLAPLATAVGSLFPTILFYFGLWGTRTAQIARNKVVVPGLRATPLIHCAYFFRFAIAAWCALVIWKFAAALKSPLNAKTAELNA